MKKSVFLFVILFLVSCTPGETQDPGDSRNEPRPDLKITLIPADTLPTEPLSDLYPDPVLDFGLSRTDMVQRLGKPERSTKDGIIYAGYSTAAPYVMYVFDDEKLAGAGVLVGSSCTKPLAAYLVERYLHVSTKGEYYYFINTPSEQEPPMLVAVTLSKSKFWSVMYLPSSQDPGIRRKLNALMHLLY